MSSVALQGNASGSGAFVVTSPNSNSNRTLTLPDATDTLAGIAATQTLTNKTLGSGLVAGASLITSGTAVASTSGTSIDFTSIPSWVKRITVMFNGVSLSGSSHPLIQVGSGSVLSSGYTSTGNTITQSSTTGGLSSAAGFVIAVGAAASAFSGHMVLTLVSGSIWVSSHSGLNSTTNVCCGGGNVSIGGTLDRVRITTVNGTDTFDTGSINIFYE